MKHIILKTLIALLTVQTLYFVVPSSAHAQGTTCSEHKSVTIDIKPDDDPNKINLSSRGLLPVAVLNTPGFDASLFTPEGAHLSDATIAMSEGCSGAEAVRWTYTDVNGDGLLDVLFFFRIQKLNLTPSSTAATLMAHGTYQSAPIHIMGTDSVIVKP